MVVMIIIIYHYYIGSFEGVLEVIGEIRDTNSEVVCVRNGCNHPECGCC